MAAQILLLNKTDLFEEKIAHTDIRDFFPVCNCFIVMADELIHLG